MAAAGPLSRRVWRERTRTRLEGCATRRTRRRRVSSRGRSGALVRSWWVVAQELAGVLWCESERGARGAPPASGRPLPLGSALFTRQRKHPRYTYLGAPQRPYHPPKCSHRPALATPSTLSSTRHDRPSLGRRRRRRHHWLVDRLLPRSPRQAGGHPRRHHPRRGQRRRRRGKWQGGRPPRSRLARVRLSLLCASTYLSDTLCTSS